MTYGDDPGLTSVRSWLQGIFQLYLGVICHDARCGSQPAACGKNHFDSFRQLLKAVGYNEDCLMKRDA